jgi:hypothetical protein
MYVDTLRKGKRLVYETGSEKVNSIELRGILKNSDNVVRIILDFLK